MYRFTLILWIMVFVLIVIGNLLVKVAYLLRALVEYILSKYYRDRVNATESTVFYGWWIFCEIGPHWKLMSHSYFVKELELAWRDFCIKTGINDVMTLRGRSFTRTSTCIIYRRPITLFTLYKIETKIFNWTSMMVYSEHRFLNRQGQLCAIAIGQYQYSDINSGGSFFDHMLDRPSTSFAGRNMAITRVQWADGAFAGNENLEQEQEDDERNHEISGAPRYRLE